MSAPIQQPGLKATRSFLYVPGDQAEMLAKATTRGADALIADLEDAVAASSKDTARDLVASWLDEHSNNSASLWVRINSQPDLARRDLTAVARAGLTGVYVPKVDSATDLGSIAAQLNDLEAAAGIEPGSIRVAPLLESAAGILAARDIAAVSRVTHIGVGEADLVADLRMHPSPGGRELNPIRLAVVIASAAAGLNPPTGPVHTNFADLESLRVTSLELRGMGYGGRGAIHPDQVPIINEAFSPSDAELADARDIAERFDAAQEVGGAITVARDGSLIDEAVARRARFTLSYLDRSADKEG